jgi:hypothetical protein
MDGSATPVCKKRLALVGFVAAAFRTQTPVNLEDVVY